jgi:hypothetical protein
MGSPSGETVAFGERPPEPPAVTAGQAAHRPGYVEAPSQVAGAEAEEGAVRPQILRLSEG